MSQHKTPKPLPKPGQQPTEEATPESIGEQVAENLDQSFVGQVPEEEQVEAAAPPPPPKPLSPVEQLVKNIRDRRDLVSKPIDQLPLATRPAWVAAQQQAQEELLQLERVYAQHVQDAAVTGVVLGPKARVEEFVSIGRNIAPSQLIEVRCDEMYERLAKAGVPALGDTRQFGSGQIGLILEEYAAIGRELFFASLGAPAWTYDIVVPTFEDFKAAIRKAIRGGEDGDTLNRAYLRMEAYKQAVAKCVSNNIVPVLVTGATEEELPFLTSKLFSVASVVRLKNEPVTEPDVVSFFKSMSTAAKKAEMVVQ